MAWRPTEYLLEGVLDNTTPGKVTGWMRFAGMKDKVTFGLEGDFHRDIRGAKIHLIGEGREDDPEAAHYFEGIAQHQKGKVGDIEFRISNVNGHYSNGDGSLDARMSERSLSWERQTRRLLA